MNIHATSLSLLWTTALRGMGIRTNPCPEDRNRPNCTAGLPSGGSSARGARWVDRVRLSAPR